MIEIKDAFKNIANEFIQEWKLVNKQLSLIYPLTVFLLIGLVVVCWWWHQDYIAIKNRYENYTQAQEVYFLKAGKYPYGILQSFKEEIGNAILYPDNAGYFRSEND